MNTLVNKARGLSALLYLAVGQVTVWQSRSLPFGSLKAIKAGFFPQVFGIVLVLLSVTLLLQLFTARKRSTATAVPAGQPPVSPLQHESVSDSESEASVQETIAQVLDEGRETAAGANEAEQEDRMDVRGFVSFIAVFAVFVAVTHYAGFIAASFVAVAGSGYLLGLRSWRLLLLTVLTACATWLLFDYWLGLSLPRGIWFD